MQKCIIKAAHASERTNKKVNAMSASSLIGISTIFIGVYCASPATGWMWQCAAIRPASAERRQSSVAQGCHAARVAAGRSGRGGYYRMTVRVIAAGKSAGNAGCRAEG